VLEPIGLLDRFKVSGVVASWWDEVKYELRTLSESGFGGLVDSWVDTIADALKPEEDEEGTTKSSREKFDPLNHKLVLQLLPDYLEEIANAEATIAELEQQKEAFEQGEDEEEGEAEAEEEGEAVNVVKELENRRKQLKASIKESQQRIKWLKRGASVKDGESIAALKKLGKDTTVLEQELAELELGIAPVEAEIAEIEAKLEPYNEIKKQLSEAKGTLRRLKEQLIDRLKKKRQALTEADCQETVLAIFKEGLRSELERYVVAHRQQVIAAIENWWDKYRVTLRDIEAERDAAAEQLDEFLKGLGYAI
jgi:type I restriction enzyme M protein